MRGNRKYQSFFYRCQDVNPIWTRVLSQLGRKFDLRSNFVSCRTVLFGYPGGKPLLNLIIILIKQYIVSAKAKESRSEISPRGIKNVIMHYFKTEKHIAKCSNSMDTFLTKWEGALDGDGDLALDTLV